MAFAGLNAEIVTIDDDDAVSGSGSQVIIRKIVSSEVVASGADGALVVPAKPKTGAPQHYWRLRASADGYVAFGSNPDASASPRLAITAAKEYFILAKEGDKVGFLNA